jgi:iron-sulfur cluster repair protein YtfE (RIC family)
MKATSLLKQQHRNTKKALMQLIKAGGQGAEALRTQMADELVAHMMIEEKIVYPRARELMKKSDLVDRSFEEHDLARYALIRLLEADPMDPSFVVKAKSLKKVFDSHIEDEENVLFPMFEKAYDTVEMRTLGQELTELFEKTVESGYENGLRALQIEPARQPKRSVAQKANAGTRVSRESRANEARS